MSLSSFSRAQEAALRALLEKESLSTKEIGATVGTKKGTGSMLGALKGRGMLRYNGSGCRPGLGRWSLSDAGRAAIETIIAQGKPS